MFFKLLELFLLSVNTFPDIFCDETINRSVVQQRLLQTFTEDVFIFSLLVYMHIRAFWMMCYTNLLTYLLVGKSISFVSSLILVKIELPFYKVRPFMQWYK